VPHHRQQPGGLRRVDPDGRVAVAPPQGVTNHPEGGVAPQRPLGGRGLGGVAALLGKAPHRQAVSTVSSAYGGSSPIACQSASWASPAATTQRSGTSPISSAGAAPSRLRPRELVEVASSANLDEALATVPPQVLSNAAGEGFLTGLNAVLTLAALLSFAGAVLALWLVREHEIQRQPLEPEGESKCEALPEAAGA
jgi:hypothetical protein